MKGLKPEDLLDAYGSDGEMSKLIHEVENLAKEDGKIRELIDDRPSTKDIAEDVANRVREYFQRISNTLEEMWKKEIQREEKMRQVIEADEQEFEKVALDWTREEFQGSSEFIDVHKDREPNAALSGDCILKAKGNYDYRIGIDFKKCTKLEKPRKLPHDEIKKVTRDVIGKRKGD